MGSVSGQKDFRIQRAVQALDKNPFHTSGTRRQLPDQYPETKSSV